MKSLKNLIAFVVMFALCASASERKFSEITKAASAQ